MWPWIDGWKGHELKKIEGSVWYTIYHHLPVVIRGKQKTPLFSSTNGWISGTSMLFHQVFGHLRIFSLRRERSQRALRDTRPHSGRASCGKPRASRASVEARRRLASTRMVHPWGFHAGFHRGFYLWWKKWLIDVNIMVNIWLIHGWYMVNIWLIYG